MSQVIAPLPGPADAPSPEALAGRIRRERERLGLTKADAARMLGIAPQSYRKLEESANPKALSLIALVRTLGMRPEALLPEVFVRPPPGG